ncbi:sperm-tail PG-rich repeat-containing protein 2 [Astyanax mexicanus]|uniref:sperm-tail PG-rich repeat-containing protein 2 n=1 Tax=Astyanax mexicanus TaxID=7994 RepID=UPI0020CAABE3|nr:sperm-tail PG-rich repeat-containing protein 2 [Astyanax mexicanus]
MYSRAPRVTQLSSGGSTSSAVGPGSYPIHANTPTRECYAPFLSLSNRLSVFDAVGGASPGPGQYNIGGIRVSGAGGVSLQNRSKRFEETQSDGPGPAAYNIPHTPAHTHTPAERRNKRVELLSYSDAPSIPSPGQAFGFEENEHSALCRNKPPDIDHSLGPAYYSPAKVKQKYKGVPFSWMTEKRAELKLVEGPGPGQYSPEEDHRVQYENVNLRRDVRSRAELQVPRYHQLLPLQEEKKGVPGPGQYDVKGQFEKHTDPAGATVPKAPFMSLTERFSPVKQVAPPVGSYNDPRSALESLKKNSGLKRSPFNLTAARFTLDHRTHSTPGPGAYNVFELGLAHESLRRVLVENTRKGVFGSCAERALQLNNKEGNSPGPSHYTIEKDTKELYKQQPTAVFRSTTERLNTALPNKDTPPPSRYDVQVAFEKVCGWRQHGKPRTDGARKRHNSFLSSAPRGLTFLHTDLHVPGPGHYSPEVKSTPKLALIGSREDRFKQPKHITPGPGTYTLSPAVQDTLLKGTFNVTLRNPLMSQALTSPPQTAMATPFVFSSTDLHQSLPQDVENPAADLQQERNCV